MTLSNQIRGLAIAALLTTSSPAYLVAQSWETVDAFQLPGLDWCQALNLAVDSSGRVFVAGRGFASGASRGSVAVRRSNDQGLTWQTVFTLEEQSHSIFSKFKVFSGAPGKMLITTGLLVYGSDDGGDSWTNLDDFVLAPGLPTYVGPEALATTRHGLFAIGAGWNVWRSTDNGATWSTVDTFQLGSSTAARGIAADASGNLFVVGNALYDSAPERWIVRRSIDGGASWTTVDNYGSAAGPAYAFAVTADNSGRLWVAGWELGAWLVRRSDDLGANWVKSDVFLIPGRTPVAYGLAADMDGNVFAAGYGGNPGNEIHAEFWIVRKLAAAPRLATEASNGSLQLSWPASATGFVLQSATTLANGGEWQDATNAPTEINGQKVVTITPTGSHGFFRLRGP